MSRTRAREQRFQGGYIPMALYVDAKSIFAAITATFIKVPADKSLLIHVQYMREQLDLRVLQAIVWVDTRDMGSDGLTKGAVSRELLHQHMAGQVSLLHPLELWSARNAPVQQMDASSMYTLPCASVGLCVQLSCNTYVPTACIRDITSFA